MNISTQNQVFCHAHRVEIDNNDLLRISLALKPQVKLQSVVLHSRKCHLQFLSGNRHLNTTLDLPEIVSPLSGQLLEKGHNIEIEAKLSAKPTGWRLILKSADENELEVVV